MMIASTPAVLCRFTWVASLLLLICGPVYGAKITVERSDHGAVVKIDGELFTEYWTQAGHAPALYPVIGPTGKAVTRSYPFGPPGETNDHPHHQSFWIAHSVNGVDFWKANLDDNVGNQGPHIAHREFVKAEGEGEQGTIVTRNDWMNGDERYCSDERELLFGTDRNGSRWIDFKLTISAPDADVTFDDTKEGFFAIRVVDSMRVDAKTGGKIVSSEGLTNEAAWGMPARWVDYTGPVDGETVGILMMVHPSSFRPQPRWHVRTYGLFAINPFGQKDFPHPKAAAQGPVTIKKGDTLKVRYKVVLHRGTESKQEIEDSFQSFASK